MDAAITGIFSSFFAVFTCFIDALHSAGRDTLLQIRTEDTCPWALSNI